MRRSLSNRAASEASSTHSTEGGRTIGRFHIRGVTKRRGGILPARLRFSAHRGVTLIGLMISMLILTLVCVAWLEIIGIQSAKKEARRREAVERFAGMMDAFLYYKTGDRVSWITTGYYCMSLSKEGGAEFSGLDFKEDCNAADVYPMFENSISPIGYQLCVTDSMSAGYVGWNGCRWVEGRLYNHSGKKTDAGDPFFTLRVCLGVK